MVQKPEQDRNTSRRGGDKRWPKTDLRHWLPRVEKRGRNFYGARFFKAGKERWLSFQTRSREDAARQAAEVWKMIERDGWDAAFTRVRPAVEAKPGTVGALIEAAQALSTARPQSLDAYAKAFRRIVAGVLNIRDDDKFKDRAREYRARVDAMRLDQITPADVKMWRNEFIRAAGTDPVSRNRAIVTTNSLIRNAKALFGKKILADLREKVVLPHTLPLDGVPLEKTPSMRYRSRIDARAILRAGREELAQDDPECFKLLLLCLGCGLRRSEADMLLWSAFDFTRRQLHIQDSEFHQLKSADSAGVIDLDEETAAIFQGFRAGATGPFVLEGGNPANRKKRRFSGRHYRADATQKRLLEWLRGKGVKDERPLHTLRKEIGSIIATEHGLFAAQRYLRHSTPTITATIYADVKKAITPGFGSLLRTEEAETVDFRNASAGEGGRKAVAL